MSYSLTMDHSQRILQSITSRIPLFLPCVSTHSQLIHIPAGYISAKTLLSNPSTRRVQCVETKPCIKLQIPKRSSQKSAKRVPSQLSSTSMSSLPPSSSSHQQTILPDPQPLPCLTGSSSVSQKRVKLNPVVQEVNSEANTSILVTKIPDLARENKLETATIPELKAYLKSKNQKVSGKKSDLIARIHSLLVWSVSYLAHFYSILL